MMRKTVLQSVVGCKLHWTILQPSNMLPSLKSYERASVGGKMRQLTVRGISDRIVAALKLRAARHGRSAEAEHRAILEAALGEASSDFWEDAGRMRNELKGRQFSDS